MAENMSRNALHAEASIRGGHSTGQMLCCGTFVSLDKIEYKPDGYWFQNSVFEVVRCPNPYCWTRLSAEDKKRWGFPAYV